MAGGAPDSVVAGRFLTNETCSDIDCRTPAGAHEDRTLSAARHAHQPLAGTFARVEDGDQWSCSACASTSSPPNAFGNFRLAQIESESSPTMTPSETSVSMWYQWLIDIFTPT